jgi:hypothetical protein
MRANFAAPRPAPVAKSPKPLNSLAITFIGFLSQCLEHCKLVFETGDPLFTQLLAAETKLLHLPGWDHADFAVAVGLGPTRGKTEQFRCVGQRSLHAERQKRLRRLLDDLGHFGSDCVSA